MKDELKDGKWGEVQGEKETSLTGFLSCTTDLMEIGGRNGRLGLEMAHGAKDGKEEANN